MCLEQIRLETDYKLKLGDRCAGLALRDQNRAEPAAQVGMIGTNAKDVTVKPFGFGEGARLVIGKGGVYASTSALAAAESSGGGVVELPAARRSSWLICASSMEALLC